MSRPAQNKLRESLAPGKTRLAAGEDRTIKTSAGRFPPAKKWVSPETQKLTQ